MAMNSLWSTSFPWWLFVVRGAVVYLAVLLLLRLGGKRQIGQMGAGEFVAILLISNAMQNAMNGGDNSVSGGLILAAVIIALSVLVAWLTYRSRRWAVWLEGRPTLLVHHGTVLHDHLRGELLSPSELRTMMRRQGIHSFEEVEVAILESDGHLSIRRKSEMPPPDHSL